MIVRRAVERLRAIWPHIETVERVCPDPAEILSSEFIGGCSARLGDLVDSAPEQIDPPLLEAIRKFREIGSDRYSRIMRRRIEHRESLRRFFEQYDLLLTPTTPCIAWELDRALPPGHEDAAVWSYFTYPFNLGHQPAGTLPIGLTARGMPVGLQFVTQMLEEPRLIASLRLSESLGLTSPTPVEVRPRTEDTTMAAP
jgi:aspartyl-tRNA(Asn)/glutamyl-tRNA(Gln) amidotransferase subunit A